MSIEVNASDDTDGNNCSSNKNQHVCRGVGLMIVAHVALTHTRGGSCHVIQIQPQLENEHPARHTHTHLATTLLVFSNEEGEKGPPDTIFFDLNAPLQRHESL
jgi:hypothetical protein